MYGWKWRRYHHNGRPVISDGDQSEPIDVIDTLFTLRSEHKTNQYCKAVNFPFVANQEYSEIRKQSVKVH